MADLVPFTPHRRPERDPLDITATDLDGRPKTATEFVGLREYLAMAQRHWWIVLLTLILSVSYTANSVLKQRPSYRSFATVRLVDSRRALAGDMAQRPPSDAYSFQSDPLESQIQVLLSEAVATVAADLKGLRLTPSNSGPFLDEIVEAKVADTATATSIVFSFTDSVYAMRSAGRSVSALYGQPAEIDGVRVVIDKRPNVSTALYDIISRDAAIGMARGGFYPGARPKTDILDFSYTGPEPTQTKRMVNAMAEAFREYNASSAKEMSKRRRAFLEGQLRQTDSSLAVANNKYASFRSSRQVFNSASRAGATESKLIDIDAQRSQLAADKDLFTRLLARTKAGGPNLASNLRVLASAPGVSDNPVVSQYYSQLMQYEKAREDLMTAGAAATHPDVVAITSLLPTTTAKFIDAVESQIQSYDSRIEALDRLRATGASKVSQLPAEELAELELQENVTGVRQMSRQLQDELQKAQLNEAVESGQVEIVQLAKYQGSEITTGKRRKLMIGILVGLMLGFGAAVLVDSLNASIRRRSDLERLLGIPGLAVIPRLSGAHGPTGWMARALPKAKKNGRPTGKPDRNLVTVHSMQSSASESFRTLRTNLMFSQAVRAMRTLVVTSASPGEGKTTTASNLAVSFAQQGMRVLLADLDLRRAAVHRVFSIPREPGLTDLVLGYETEEAVTRATSVSGLYVIPAGKLPPNPSELLAGDGMRKTLATLTEGYDVIVIDTPPLLAASDAAIIATLADGVIMVIRAGKTDISAALQSTQQLNAVGARVVGAVLNDPDAQVPKYGAYYQYEYSTPR